MYGAIIGDICGSYYLYGRPEKRFTDIAARFLPAEMMNIVTAFEKKYMANYKPVQ